MIDEVQPGQEPTFLHPQFANKVIKKVNSLLRPKTDPQDLMTVTEGDEDITYVFQTEEFLVIRDGVVTTIEAVAQVVEEFL